ncbi:MAG: protoheme IX farnesyltransferase [Chloroflexi bacterium]|nr:protoheme IX farnesyltransferase [Chloroflexota bacterium]
MLYNRREMLLKNSRIKLAETIWARVRMYWALTKSLQTGLLLLTGLAGYFSARCPTHSTALVLALAGSLFAAIAGSTVLNMVYDRDIDALMLRACRRPLPANRMSAREALWLGGVLSLIGIAWAFALSPLYGAVVLAGWCFDVIVYTLWLKRRSVWAILWGGIAGAMPILAGRVLGAGQIDLVGVLFALAILLWIPTHLLTFGIKYAEQYRAAGVPIFPNRYGEAFTRGTIALSTACATIAMSLAASQIGLPAGYFHLALWLSALLVGVALLSVFRRSSTLNFALYKFASLYMLGAMALIVLGMSLN